MCFYFIYTLVSNYNIYHSKQASTLGGEPGGPGGGEGVHVRAVRHGFRLERIKTTSVGPAGGCVWPEVFSDCIVVDPYTFYCM